MAGRHVNNAHFFAIQMQLKTICVSNHRKRHLCAGLLIALTSRHAYAHIVVRHDNRARLTKIFVPARMVIMPVGVDQKLDRLSAKRGNGGLNFLGQRGELVINQNRTIFAVGNTNVAASAKQHSHARRDLFGLDFNFGKILS